MRFFPVQSNAAQIEAMRSGGCILLGSTLGPTRWRSIVSGSGRLPLWPSVDGNFGYEMEILTYPGSGGETVTDIKGGKLAFTSPISNSGFKVPSAILKPDFDLITGHDFEPVYSGKHDNSILGAATKDYPAASIANSVMHRMISCGVISEDQVITIYKSQTLPTTGFGTAHNMTPDLLASIREAFFSFEWEGSTLEEELSKSSEGQFLEMTYQDFWDVIRKIDTANGVSYACQ